MNFRFSKSFDEAIEAKTTAEQLKLKADRDLERIKVEAEQRIAMALRSGLRRPRTELKTGNR